MRSACLILSCLVLSPSAAWGQRAAENVVADAEDAFGSNLGGEALGVYGPSDVRGFSPIDAGNVRLDGVYIDRQGELTSRLVEGSRIRVGPSAVGYAFPAPSGIVDYRLRKPGDAAVISVSAKAESLGARQLEVDALLPIRGKTLGLAAGVGQYFNDFASGATSDVLSTSVVLAWRPTPTAEITPFWSRIRVRDEEAEAVVLGDGARLPPRLERHRLIAPPWADFEVVRMNYGAVGHTRLGEVSLRGGVFRSFDRATEGYSVFLPVPAGGEALVTPRLVADPFRERASTSGEVTAARRFIHGAVRHDLQVSVRARRQTRVYGGSSGAPLPPTWYGAGIAGAAPALVFGPQSQGVVRQQTAGLAYSAVVEGRGVLNMAVQKSRYRKTVETPLGELPTSRAEPWLLSASVLATLNPRLAVYAGATQGLEESDVAPETATNRDEAPPAIRTEQVEGGLRWRPFDKLTLVAGAFSIEKPYYGLDQASVFRRLGQVRHQGLEASLVGEPLPDVTLVLGGVLLDAQVSGQEVAQGAVGPRPVGTPNRTVSASLDWRPAGGRLSFDAGLQHEGPRYADALNRVRVPALTTIDVGVRYRLRLAGAPATLRVQVTNLFDAFGWAPVSSNAFLYAKPRIGLARLTVDF
jgi:iron complex outermembrane receptor protein